MRHTKQVLARVCNLWLLFFLIFSQTYFQCSRCTFNELWPFSQIQMLMHCIINIFYYFILFRQLSKAVCVTVIQMLFLAFLIILCDKRFVFSLLNCASIWTESSKQKFVQYCILASHLWTWNLNDDLYSSCLIPMLFEFWRGRWS